MTWQLGCSISCSSETGSGFIFLSNRLNKDPKICCFCCYHTFSASAASEKSGYCTFYLYFGCWAESKKSTQMRIKNRHNFRSQKYRKSISEVGVNKGSLKQKHTKTIKSCTFQLTFHFLLILLHVEVRGQLHEGISSATSGPWICVFFLVPYLSRHPASSLGDPGSSQLNMGSRLHNTAHWGFTAFKPLWQKQSVFR